MKNRISAATAIRNIKGTAKVPLFWKALKTSAYYERNTNEQQNILRHSSIRDRSNIPDRQSDVG
jgi:hypothetical protein